MRLSTHVLCAVALAFPAPVFLSPPPRRGRNLPRIDLRREHSLKLESSKDLPTRSMYRVRDGPHTSKHPTLRGASSFPHSRFSESIG